ncbi:MAG: PfkB family carbohydrate kinase [Pirellulaceae bacterium]
MDVICIGRTLVDVVVQNATQMPPRFVAQRVGRVRLAPGGGAYHCARAMSMLGHDVVAYGYAGKDSEGWLLDQYLRGEEFASRIAKSDDTPTPVNVVFVDMEGHARYLMHSDTTATARSLLLPEASKARAHIVHVSTINQLIDCEQHPLALWLRDFRATHPGVPISADMSKLIKHCSGNILHLKGLVDYLFGNRAELAMLADCFSMQPESQLALSDEPLKAAHAILEGLSCKMVVTTLSSQGAIATQAHDDISVRGFHVDAPANTNGAGDIFCSAFLHHHVGESLGVEESLHRANYLASLHVAGELSPAAIKSARSDELFRKRRSVTVPINESAFLKRSQTRFGYGESYDRTRWIPPQRMRAWVDRIIQFGRINASSVVLDAGCGTGRFAIPLASQSGCRVIGVDYSAEMLRLAELKAERVRSGSDKATANLALHVTASREEFVGPHIRDLSQRVRFICGNLLRLDEVLPESNNSFDCILLSSVFSQLKDCAPEVLQQLYAALEESGRLVMRVRCRELIDHVGWYRVFKRARAAALEKFAPLSTIVSHLHSGGFEIVHLERFLDRDFLTREALKEKFAAGGYSWCDLYSEEELTKAIEQLIRSSAERYPVWSPCYFIVAEKRRISEEALQEMPGL